MTGFIVSVFPFRNRVSPKEAFEGLELGEGKPSRPVLRGPGGRNAARLLGSHPLCPFLGLSGDQASSFFTRPAGGDSSTDDVKVNSRMVPNVASPNRLVDSLSGLPSF